MLPRKEIQKKKLVNTPWALFSLELIIVYRNFPCSNHHCYVSTANDKPMLFVFWCVQNGRKIASWNSMSSKYYLINICWIDCCRGVTKTNFNTTLRVYKTLAFILMLRRRHKVIPPSSGRPLIRTSLALLLNNSSKSWRVLYLLGRYVHHVDTICRIQDVG